MMDEYTIGNMLEIFQTKIGMFKLGNEKNVLKLEDGGKLFTFRFDVDNQRTEINYYILMKPVNGINTFPLFMQSNVVEYGEKKQEELAQDILGSVSLFDFSEEAFLKRLNEIEKNPVEE